VNNQIPSEIIVTPSNDPRSYRLSSKKLLATGFNPRYGVNDGIQDVIAAYRDGRLIDEERYYNIKTMKKLTDLS
jgi:nucleoside-diphosphate-sugar epimerase